MTLAPGKGAPRTKAANPAEPAEKARANRARRIAELRARERLLPSLELYSQRIAEFAADGKPEPEVLAMSYITDIFVAGYAGVQAQIHTAGKTGIGAINAIKRSAGTNFQGLCEYAILRWLDTTTLPVNIGPNTPKGLKEELTIYGNDVSGPFAVEPDIDLCLWQEEGSENSRIIFVSAKTSLVDRARSSGMTLPRFSGQFAYMPESAPYALSSKFTGLRNPSVECRRLGL